jgi:hypothetical protein
MKCCNEACTIGCESCAMADTGVGDGSCVNLTGKDPNHMCGAMMGTCNGANQCSCTDGTMNFMETDIDCGGPMCPQCGQGKKCNGDGDCQTGHCANGVCCDSDCKSKGMCWACNLAPNWVGRCEAIMIGSAGGGCNAPMVCDDMQHCINTNIPMPEANNTLCNNNNQCVSNHCTGNPGTCRPWEPKGGICNNSSNCQNGTCQTDFTCN